VRSLLVASVFLGLACGERRAFEVPPEIEYVAWIELDGAGEVISSSPLAQVAEAPVWVVDDDRSLYFVGFDAGVIDPLLLRTEAAGWETVPLSKAGPCDPALEPHWSSALQEGQVRTLPELTAPWLVGACGQTGVRTPVCAECSDECALEVTEYALTFDGDAPANVILGGLIRSDERTLMATLQSGASGDFVSVISLAEPTAPSTTVQPHYKVTQTIAFDGLSPWVGNDLGQVIRLRADGTADTTLQAGARRPILVAAAPETDVFAFQYGGALLKVASSTATLQIDADPPIFDVAVDSFQVAVLRYDEVVLYHPITGPKLIPLPVGVRHEDFTVYDRARIALVNGALLFGVRNSPVHLYDGTGWIALGWPTSDTQPRTFAWLDGGFLVGGQDGGQSAIGLLYYQRGAQNCQAGIFHGRVNALVTSADQKVAYAVTEGLGRPYLLEIRVR
jgi:hypothetical protein